MNDTDKTIIPEVMEPLSPWQLMAKEIATVFKKREGNLDMYISMARTKLGDMLNFATQHNVYRAGLVDLSREIPGLDLNIEELPENSSLTPEIIVALAINIWRKIMLAKGF